MCECYWSCVHDAATLVALLESGDNEIEWEIAATAMVKAKKTFKKNKQNRLSFRRVKTRTV